ncbi:hypothetical protein E8E14_011984 [Neopestalotiopsis sp. 37M]|nr:hypothetical protein E8E14_011984 [Neopestalotiopsis sp. 37M]
MLGLQEDEYASMMLWLALFISDVLVVAFHVTMLRRHGYQQKWLRLATLMSMTLLVAVVNLRSGLLGSPYTMFGQPWAWIGPILECFVVLCIFSFMNILSFLNDYGQDLPNSPEGFYGQGFSTKEKSTIN